jgi:hypothetical protein
VSTRQKRRVDNVVSRRQTLGRIRRVGTSSASCRQRHVAHGASTKRHVRNVVSTMLRRLRRVGNVASRLQRRVV